MGQLPGLASRAAHTRPAPHIPPHAAAVAPVVGSPPKGVLGVGQRAARLCSGFVPKSLAKLGRNPLIRRATDTLVAVCQIK